jgi:hypothetical protein
MQRISQQQPPLDTADPQIGNLVQALLWAFFRPELSFPGAFFSILRSDFGAGFFA